MRSRFLVVALLLIVASKAEARRAVHERYRGTVPAPGAIIAFDSTGSLPGGETRAATPRFLIPGSVDPSHRKIGTLELDPAADSVVVLVYGDNRPGFRMMTTPWGASAVLSGLESPDFTEFLWGLVNVPVAVIQGVIPKLDLFRDLYSAYWGHHFTGGAEDRVLRALTRELERPPKASLVVQTGDVVENGRRGAQWETYARKHAPLRQSVAYVASPGNHEATFDPIARDSWDAVMGKPPEPERYWYAIDFPESIARVVFLDSNVLADPKDRYPDSLERVLADEQLAWVDSALAAPARYKFVVMHHPLVSSGRYLADWRVDDSRPVEARRRGSLLEICRRRGVTAVFAGHEHLYQRTYIRGRDGRGFWHITSGGGGSPLYRLSDRERKLARAASLPDSARVTWIPERSDYHFARLTIVRRAPAQGESLFLEAYRVRGNGSTERFDRVDLAQPPEVNVPLQ